MADELSVSNHLSARNGVDQYVRQVPDDLRAAFPFPESRGRSAREIIGKPGRRHRTGRHLDRGLDLA